MVTEFLQHIVGEIGAYTGAAIGALLIFFYNKAHTQYKKYKANRLNSIPKLVETDIIVYQYLTELLVQTNCDRAFVMLFHNGQFYANNLSQTKFSCTHEIVKHGVSREHNNLQDLLLSRFTKFLTEIIAKKTVRLKVTNEDTSYFANILRQQSVDKCVISALRNGDAIDGFVAISYVDSNNWGSVSEEDKKKTEALLEETSMRIGFTLRNRK
jgi:hypothetical protein